MAFDPEFDDTRWTWDWLNVPFMQIYQAVGDYIHLTTSGDDFGTQIGPFMAPVAFRDLIKPYFAERIAFTRQFTKACFWHHIPRPSLLTPPLVVQVTGTFKVPVTWTFALLKLL
jgi:uroporphyrinogen decarboxylase